MGSRSFTGWRLLSANKSVTTPPSSLLLQQSSLLVSSNLGYLISVSWPRIEGHIYYHGHNRDLHLDPGSILLWYQSILGPLWWYFTNLFGQQEYIFWGEMENTIQVSRLDVNVWTQRDRKTFSLCRKEKNRQTFQEVKEKILFSRTSTAVFLLEFHH